MHLLLVLHLLPLWFLVLALFLPRLSLFLMYLQHPPGEYSIVIGIFPLLFWLLLPRAFVLYVIYVDQGVSVWFLIHLVVAVMVWGGSGRYHSRRRRRDDF
jgi:hypothetical protein